MPDRRRADARRNYARILAVAEEEVAAHGADASLEQIARVAGVGSATVRRHFPSRRALLTAVSRGRIEALRVRAHELAAEDDSRAALLAWLNDVLAYCVAARGLAAALAYDSAASDPVHDNACAATLQEAADPLLRRAVQDGAVDPDVTVADLISLLVGIALATEHGPDPAARAGRLFRLATAGVGAPRGDERLSKRLLGVQPPHRVDVRGEG
ncbi:Bacterial regulatory protein, tetR family [Actinomadura rubteroloni]|uniref:Bacterial regulatory protein, tetR family n=1 Tax=Actinomadura rubteroloni TaxID=1926885 RepID=A0A2P4UEP7_9ACTN|nr:TetR/AcrR family transcriptional regulator [Actinomadura rubteroloni]POM23537.1 Bacterial regulatory protein, tetR family [Actinomadura rubteroloni]